MIGCDSDGRGGIASVVRAYQAAGFLGRWSVRYLTSTRAGSLPQKAGAAAATCAALVGLAVRERLGIVHVHSSSRSSFARKSIFLAIARAGGAVTLFHLHSGEFERFVHGAGPLLRWWVCRTLARSTGVIVLSESWRQAIHDLVPSARIVVIPNPVEIPAVAPAPPAECRRLLFLGRADRKKGVFVLVDAVARLVPEFPDLTLVVAGDGDLRALRSHGERAGLGERLEVLGWIDPERRQEELRRAAAFVLPSYGEGLPMALLEAMAAGRPVVATRVGGIPEVVGHEQEGLLVEPGDVPGLTSTLRRLLADAALRGRLGRQARDKVAAGYSREIVLDSLSRLYERLGRETLSPPGPGGGRI